MNKFKTISYLRRELGELNSQIDSCIVSGRSYENLARRHKSIVSKIDRAYNEMNFSRALKFFSLL